MNSVLNAQLLSAPHLLPNHRLSPSHQPHQQYSSMSGRKRKASEEPENDRMSTSPSASPSISGRPLPSAHRSNKRTRTTIASGKPLALSRLLETLSAEEMRQLLQNVCDQHPEIQREIVTQAPRPSIDSTLSVLRKYEKAFQGAFPYGGRMTSDYSYNRVRQHLLQLIDAVREYTPHFLPPHETQDALSLEYLDAVTEMVHRLTDWDSPQYRRYKDEAYDEIAKAWALVIRESSKRAGGFRVQFGDWDHKLVEHNQRSGGKMDEAVNELRAALCSAQQPHIPTAQPGVSDQRASIRQQLFGGTYGQQHQLGVGPGAF